MSPVPGPNIVAKKAQLRTQIDHKLATVSDDETFRVRESGPRNGKLPAERISTVEGYSHHQSSKTPGQGQYADDEADEL